VEVCVVHDWDWDAVSLQQANDFRAQFSYDFSHVAHAKDAFDLGLRVGEQRPFAFEQHQLPVFPKVGVSEL
jgi:hypothetical protein